MTQAELWWVTRWEHFKCMGELHSERCHVYLALVRKPLA